MHTKPTHRRLGRIEGQLDDITLQLETMKSELDQSVEGPEGQVFDNINRVAGLLEEAKYLLGATHPFITE